MSGLFRDTITRLDPDRMVVNTSRNNVHADGLTLAIYEMLRDYLSDTPYADRLVSAEHVINALRGRKTPEELARIKRAVEITDEIYNKTFTFTSDALGFDAQFRAELDFCLDDGPEDETFT